MKDGEMRDGNQTIQMRDSDSDHNHAGSKRKRCRLTGDYTYATWLLTGSRGRAG